MLRRIMDATVTASPARTTSPWFALGVLGLVYLMNFLDRTLIYILFSPIKKELVFTDLQLALLGSTSFVLFYTTLGVPFGRLADRVSRTKLIAAGLVTWSVFSGLTGFATGFWTLFACRVMVGVGEATLGPAAMSLLSDLFDAKQRGTVQSVYSAGIPLGAAAAFFLGGHVAEVWGWRSAFWMLGFPGVALAAVVLTLPDPRRGVVLPKEPTDWRPLLGSTALRWHVAGYALMAVASNSLSIWVPSLLGRVHQIPLTTIGNLSGLSMAIAGGLGTMLGGYGADRLAIVARSSRMRFGMLLALACAPVWALLLFAPTVSVVYVAYFLLAGLGLAWLGPAAADVHEIVGPKLRGVGIASYFLVVNLVGYGAAPAMVGWLSDKVGLTSSLIVCPAACCVAAFCLWRGDLLRRPARG